MKSQPIKWHGGKSYLAKKIIDLCPPHLHYVEPFFGGGSVLFQKDPYDPRHYDPSGNGTVETQGCSEVVNDISGELVNFWRVLASNEKCSQLLGRLANTPFSEDVFEEDARIYGVSSEIDRAWVFFIRYRQSRQGLGKDFATVVRTRTRRGMQDCVSAWLSAVEGLPEAHERLKRVMILNRDALDVIRQNDGPHTLFYLDPPYLHETRHGKGANSEYENEMSIEQHSSLLDQLATCTKGSKFILSGYHSEMYDEFATSQHWRCVETRIDNKASASKTKEVKTECLWMNY